MSTAEKSSGASTVDESADGREKAAGWWFPLPVDHDVSHVPEAEQWVNNTRGRIAIDGYSWLQAVHWVAGSGVYVPTRRHGPRVFGATTVRLAQVMASLSPCRPGIEYLVRRTGLSERSVQYHMEMLREAGLLAYVLRGTRVKGGPAQASEFVLVIPASFDAAMGVRTVGGGVRRRMVAVADQARELMGHLAKAAAGRPRGSRCGAGASSSRAARRPAAQVPAGRGRCTPMGGSTSASSSTGTSSCPSEGIASGKSSRATPISKPCSPSAGRNPVRRRFRLAAELVRRVPWMDRASVPRIAWIVREVSDAGWTADDVIAWLATGDAPERVQRPSGFLARRLQGATGVWPHAAARAAAVEQIRDCRRAEHARHVDWQGTVNLPRARGVATAMNRAFHEVRTRTATVTHDMRSLEEAPAMAMDDTGRIDLDQLTRNEVLDLRTLAAKDPSLIDVAIDVLGESQARRLYTHQVINQVLRRRNGGRLILQQRRETA
ncbi:helix-turn-helix domain-containing protein [Actinacidiphila glaucinigra]|uniref:helix-turn-helix domain-containing protein n=1 Tax=Actinacidiphila glaucinigra TaxID=235986 RepID=UPI0033BDD95D